MMEFLMHNIVGLVAIVISLIALALSLCKERENGNKRKRREACTYCEKNKYNVNKDRPEEDRKCIQPDAGNPVEKYYLGEQEREYRENLRRKKLTATIIICSTIVSIISIAVVVGFELFYDRAGEISNTEMHMDKVLSMQSITLTITGIAISMIALISTMLTTNREEKFVRMEERLDNQAERITRENEEISQQRKDNREQLEEVSRNAEQITDIVVAQTTFLENTKIRWLKSMTSRSPIYVKYIYLQMIYNKCRKDDISEARKIEYCKLVYDEGCRCLEEYNKRQDAEFGFNRSPEVVLLELMIADVTLTMARKAKLKTDDEYRGAIARFEEAENRFKDILEKYEYSDDDGYVNNGLGLVKYWKYKYMCERGHNGKAAESLLDDALHFYNRACTFGDKYEFYSNIGVVYSQLLKLRVTEKYDALKNAYKDTVGEAKFNENIPSILMYKSLRDQRSDKLTDYFAKDKACEDMLKESKKNYDEARKRSKMAVTPWINLAGVCIDNIRRLMMLDEECVILSSVLFMVNDTEYLNRVKEGVEKDYSKAKSYLERAQDCDSFKIDCYFKMAQLKCYYILYLKLFKKPENDNIIETLKTEIKEDFARCDVIDDTCLSTKYIRRMYYDVIDDFDKAMQVDKVIVKKGGTSSWSIAFDNYKETVKSFEIEKVTQTII